MTLISKKNGMQKQRVRIEIMGAVQGVGFRFTTHSLARRHNLSGWVRNLYDGRVETLAQGTSSDLGSFLNDLRQQFDGYITDEEIEWEKCSKSLDEFSIKLN